MAHQLHPIFRPLALQTQPPLLAHPSCPTTTADNPEANLDQQARPAQLLPTILQPGCAMPFTTAQESAKGESVEFYFALIYWPSLTRTHSGFPAAACPLDCQLRSIDHDPCKLAQIHFQQFLLPPAQTSIQPLPPGQSGPKMQSPQASFNVDPVS
ncbi:hypothetical protein PtA15_1A566 [Puccinia triticina]|uniref:Uncharacterized protein n=1 Tax=Puccinia triticina TaxID=208348 RepID=A0ABY7C7U1_9BASI|nr:uncharacterized protein PtA15_1A566 [Puccinia triticina]WAQ81226.1 hypothetical protein PtA15_1A566 [Puccinia triticina]